MQCRVKKDSFLHRKLWRVGFRCQKGYLFSPFLVARGVWYQKECFPAPKVAPRQSLVRRKGISCTGSCREENTLQQLSGAEEVYGWEYECGAGQKEYQSIGHRYAVGFEEQGCLWVNCPKKNAYCCPQQHHNCHSC